MEELDDIMFDDGWNWKDSEEVYPESEDFEDDFEDEVLDEDFSNIDFDLYNNIEDIPQNSFEEDDLYDEPFIIPDEEWNQ